MKNIVYVAKVLSTDIRSRANAEIIKKYISSDSNVVLDFTEVTFISRSFADELYNIVQLSHCKVDLQNTCQLVDNMLKAVSNSRSKKRVYHNTDDDIYICKDMESLARVLLA
jgi:hypothetical protein